MIDVAKSLEIEMLALKEFFLNLKGKYRFSRLGKCFKTHQNKYFFDSGTGKVFQINEDLYNILEILWTSDSFEKLCESNLSADTIVSELKTLKEFIEKENILQMPPMTAM